MRWRPGVGLAVGVPLLAVAIAVLRLHGPHESSRVSTRPRFARSLEADRFIRGNLHAHSNRSDGGDTPEAIITWYREHHYGFLALTDHNVLSDVAALREAAGGEIVLIPGEEISMWVHGLQVHVNALCTRSTIEGGTFPLARVALEHAVSEIVAQRGVALINHPNFDWALTSEDVESASSAQLLEIASGHPYVHSAGDDTHPSHEQIWDDVLTRGHDVMAVAVDDMHHLTAPAEPAAYPGVAWVSVFASERSEQAICDALRKGALVASTGPELLALHVREATYDVVPANSDARVEFIGRHGVILERQIGTSSYRVRGGEGYVRARVVTAKGILWTPAVRVEGGSAP